MIDIPQGIPSQIIDLAEKNVEQARGAFLGVLDENKAIVGALLVRRDDFDWGFRNGDTVHVSYAAIAPTHRDQGVLASMLTEIQRRKVPVLASVKNGNHLGFADELEKLGFDLECTAASDWGDLYKWQPSPSH